MARVSKASSDFYKKSIEYRGIPIRASSVVVSAALKEARRRLDMMLCKMPAAVANLVTEGCELHIIGRNQQTSDLPEHRHWKGRIYEGNMTIDQRTRGVGGMYASCGEENLLKLKKDRYYGYDICVHEFAHTLMEFGLDNVIRDKIERQYHLSLADKRWKGMYAAKNENEFFAELTTWYFGTRGNYGHLKPSPRPGPKWFRKYDPDAYELLNQIYSGKLAPKRLKLVKLKVISPKAEEKFKSKKYDQPSTIRIHNKSKETVRLYWIDYKGRRKFYYAIEPGRHKFMTTFATHPFILTDGELQGLAIFEAIAEPAYVVLRQADVIRARRLKLPNRPSPIKALSPSREGALKSRTRKNYLPTAIRFENRTSKKVKLFWLDGEGKRQPYGTIAPGRDKLMQTWATYPYVLTSTKDKALAIFVATVKTGIATLIE